jgi:hypothetical protein
MDARNSCRNLFRRAWWFAAAVVLLSGLWQCYGAWLLNAELSQLGLSQSGGFEAGAFV